MSSLLTIHQHPPRIVFRIRETCSIGIGYCSSGSVTRPYWFQHRCTLILSAHDAPFRIWIQLTSCEQKARSQHTILCSAQITPATFGLLWFRLFFSTRYQSSSGPVRGQTLYDWSRWHVCVTVEVVFCFREFCSLSLAFDFINDLEVKTKIFSTRLQLVWFLSLGDWFLALDFFAVASSFSLQSFGESVPKLYQYQWMSPVDCIQPGILN